MSTRLKATLPLALSRQMETFQKTIQALSPNRNLEEDFWRHVLERLGVETSATLSPLPHALPAVLEVVVQQLQDLAPEAVGRAYETSHRAQRSRGEFYTPPGLSQGIIERTLGVFLSDRQQQVNQAVE